VSEEVEGLEHHVHLLTDLRDIGLPVENVDAVDVDGAAARLLEKVETAEKRALPRTGRTDDRDDLALLDLHADIAQDGDVAESFREMLDGDHA
jgi:hypothetical protein